MLTIIIGVPASVFAKVIMRRIIRLMNSFKTILMNLFVILMCFELENLGNQYLPIND